jgi:hypothetical protein
VGNAPFSFDGHMGTLCHLRVTSTNFQHVMNVDVCDIIQTVVPTIPFQLKFIMKCSGMQILKKNTGEYEQWELSEQW